MTPELENKIIEALGKLEPLVNKFSIAMMKPSEPVRWFTPRELGLKALAVSARLSPSPDLQMILVALHGAIDILGFRETVRLAMILRRKHAGKPAAKKA